MDQQKNPNFSLEGPRPSAPEQAPPAAAGETNKPEVAPAAPEKQAEYSAPAESPRPSQGQGAVLPPVQTPVTTPQQSPQPAPENTTQSSLVADDVDIIEMEWVKRAEQIIEETKDDPHAQEEAVEALQVEYLDKRYGKKIKRSRSG